MQRHGGPPYSRSWGSRAPRNHLIRALAGGQIEFDRFAWGVRKRGFPCCCSTSAGGLAWWLWAPCASNWPAHATDPYTGPWNAKTKTPILLISARYDAGTPYRNAQVAEQRLGNAVLLTLNGYGHPSYQVRSECTDGCDLGLKGLGRR